MSLNNNNKIEILARNYWIPDSTVKKVDFPPFKRCILCTRMRDDNDFVSGESYGQMGKIKQFIILCRNCYEEYKRLSNHTPKLVTADRVTTAEDQIIKSCESIVSKSSSPDNLDFYDVMKNIFNSNPETRYFFGDDVENIHADNKHLWRFRHEIWKQYKF